MTRPSSGAQARLLLVTNAAAGSVEADALEPALTTLRSAGADVVVVAPETPDDLPRLLAGRDDRTVVVAGGDGTLHLVVAALHARGELSDDDPIGLLPLGTGNDFARTVGVPLDAAGAARAVLGGVTATFDLAVDDDGGVFVNAAHAGLGAEAARRAESMKPRLGKVAYPVGSALAAVRERGWRLTVEVDGGVVADGSRHVLMVAVANGRTIGGGTPVAPDAEPGDGLLDVVVAFATGPLSRAAYGAALARGRHVGRKDVRTARARRVAVHGEPFPLDVDGELHGPLDARTWTVAPGAWSLFVPPH